MNDCRYKHGDTINRKLIDTPLKTHEAAPTPTVKRRAQALQKEVGADVTPLGWSDGGTETGNINDLSRVHFR